MLSAVRVEAHADVEARPQVGAVSLQPYPAVVHGVPLQPADPQPALQIRFVVLPERPELEIASWSAAHHSRTADSKRLPKQTTGCHIWGWLPGAELARRPGGQLHKQCHQTGHQ